MMRPRRVVPVFVLVCLLPVAIGLSLGIDPATPAYAADGLAVSSTYSYTVDPTAEVVRVAAEMAFTNTVPNRVEGNSLNRTFFSGISVPLPVEATNVVATQNGTPLSLVPAFIDGTVDYFLQNIGFAGDLFYGNTANVVLTYDIVGREPRDAGSTRVNAAYVAFSAFGIADPGNLTVRVVVPAGYVVDTFGGDAAQATETEEGGNTVYTATGIAQPDKFNLLISARNDDSLTTEDRVVGDADFVVRAWPGDTAWTDFVTQRLDQGVPALEQLIGQPWPQDQPVEVSEAVTAYLHGYAGFYDASNHQLEIGEDLDPQVLIHELAHAWFNDRWFSDRWISEGFAETYADLVNRQLGAAPVVPDPIDSAAAGAQPLDTWGDTSIDEGSGDAEDYGYNASWFVIAGIVDDIGIDGMKQVLAAVESGQIPYAGDGPAEQFSPLGDWRRLLDLTEQTAGSTAAAGLVRQYVVTPAEAPLLTERADARAAYDALETAGGDWAPPFTVRKLMSSWTFDKARAEIAESNTALVKRDQLSATLHDLGVAMDPAIEHTYEGETIDLGRTIGMLDSTISAADADVEARNHAMSAMQGIGVAPTATFESSYHDETSTLAEVRTNLNDIIDATGDVAAAIEIDDESRSVYEKVGLYGDDVDALLDEAKAALANGDTDLARAKAQQAVDTIDASTSVGRSRVLTGALILAGLALLLIVALLVVRRHRRSHSAVVAADVPA